MKMRPPAIPLITHDPYFSVWFHTNPHRKTQHWTGWPNTIHMTATIDGKAHSLMGVQKELEKAEYLGVDIDAFSTTLKYKIDDIDLSVKFTSPILITDLYLSSRPVTYCKVSYASSESHDIKIKLSLSEEFVLERRGIGRAFSEVCDIDGVSAIKMSKGEQKMLTRSGDDLRIDWGSLYLGAEGEANIGCEVFDDMYAVYVEKALDSSSLFVIGYDDVKSIVYFGDMLPAYWKKDGKTIGQAIVEAINDYDATLEKCNAFSDKLIQDARKVGNEEYAELLTLAYRQVMAAHKLVVDKDGNNLFISKECFSNGCAATVDVTYPSSPLFLLYNTELLKGMLRPIMKFNDSGLWKYDFAPHDVGQYPILNGQVYNIESVDGQMPVEECGNMIILFAAICKADKNCEFVMPYINTVKKWNEYLIKYGLDPENQLCTDDFAGHLAHNVNLAIKAIMGIAGYAEILSMLGEKDEADKNMKIAKEYALSLIERARNSDGSFRLAFDKPETFSLKYNSVWDKIWKTNIFPESFYEGEMKRYIKELRNFGVPLDSRQPYTKSDWEMWAACLAENKEDFDKIVHALWSAYNSTHDLVPMTDWYWAETSEMVMFRNRTVQGGLFIKLLF